MSNGMPASGHATSRVPGHATSRSNAYDPALVRELIMGPNPLRLCEETLDDAAAHGCALAPGSLVLDLGSGRGLTSAFLARHWGVRVVAADLWGNPADALATSARLGLGARDVLPVHADACDLPFAEEVFDAVTCIDAYNYFGRASAGSASLRPRGTFAWSASVTSPATTRPGATGWPVTTPTPPATAGPSRPALLPG